MEFGLIRAVGVLYSVGRRGTEYAYDEHALHKAYRAKVTKHHTWLKVYVEITENESNCK